MWSFFCTVGSGLEPFCRDELVAMGCLVTQVVQGKVFFQSQLDPERLLLIGTAERLFAMLEHKPRLDVTWQRSEAARLATLFAESVPTWSEPFQKWVDFQGWRKEAKKAKMTITFRVSAKVGGGFKRTFKPVDVARLLSHEVKSVMKWDVDLRAPLVEIYVQLNNDGITIGLPVSVQPISERVYLLHTNLRSTVCRAMAMWGGISPGDTVLDPMCGAATIIIEALRDKPSFSIAIDIDASQLEKAAENVAYAETKNVALLQGDAQCLPLEDCCINVVLCDLPFGLKYGTVESVRELIPLVVQEMDRVGKLGARMVLLISQDLHKCLERAAESCRWTSVQHRRVKLGILEAVICAFKKEGFKGVLWA